jgi:tRNA(Ile)-lysidine synthase
MVSIHSVSCQACMKHPFPKHFGSKLIRALHQAFRKNFNSHILIAISGGKDSIALAHVLLKYGKNCISKHRIKLLYVDHQWHSLGLRDQDPSTFLRKFASQWDTPLWIEKVDPNVPKGASVEAVFRERRLEVFRSFAKRHQTRIVTGHTLDDLAETLLWRLCSTRNLGSLGGMKMLEGIQFRPLLKTRGSLCLSYLEEEGQSFVEDNSNQSDRFLRSRMRKHLLPVIEELFPGGIEKLGMHAWSLQKLLSRPCQEAKLKE